MHYLEILWSGEESQISIAMFKRRYNLFFCLWPSAIRREWGNQSQILLHTKVVLTFPHWPTTRTKATLAWCLSLPATNGALIRCSALSGGTDPGGHGLDWRAPCLWDRCSQCDPWREYDDSWLAHCCWAWMLLPDKLTQKMTPKEVEAFCLSSSSPCFSAPRLQFGICYIHNLLPFLFISATLWMFLVELWLLWRTRT